MVEASFEVIRGTKKIVRGGGPYDEIKGVIDHYVMKYLHDDSVNVRIYIRETKIT